MANIKHALQNFDHIMVNPIRFAIPSSNRILLFNEFGSKDGFPMIHFHGSGCSRMECLLLDDVAKQYNVRIICADRSGVGDTSVDKELSYKSHCNDIAHLINHLNIKSKKFAVCGVSQGSTWSYSCLHFLPSLKLEPKFALMLSSAGPYMCDLWDEKEIEKVLHPFLKSMILGIKYPKLYEYQEQFGAWMMKKYPKLWKKLVIKSMGEYDMNFFDNLSGIDYLQKSFNYCNKNGVKGNVMSNRMMMMDWGYNLKTDIDFEKYPILAYSGKEDPNWRWIQQWSKIVGFQLNGMENAGHCMSFDEHFLIKIFDEVTTEFDLSVHI